jgi:hypothetical protein
MRVKALEDMVKLGQMEYATFEALRDEIVGGDVKNVHLVKGLDRKLLERVRRGEDVLSDSGKPIQVPKGAESPQQLDPTTGDAAVDEEFGKLGEKEVQPLSKVETDKKGQMAPPPAVAGRKRTRDDILKELKASRQAAATHQKAPELSLGSRFSKVGEKKERSRIEIDQRGREVLITVDEDGKVKKKVKKSISREEPRDRGLLMPDKGVKPLGIEIAQQAPPPEDEETDIFEGVGAVYDPLESLEDDDESEESEEQGKPSPPCGNGSDPASRADTDASSMPPPPLPEKAILGRRNYFGDAVAHDVADTTSTSNSLSDPTILAALKKASSLKPLSLGSASPHGEEEAAKLARRKKMLDSHDRDAEDMDLGFGSSRFGDEEDADERKVKLSEWGEDRGKQDGRGDGKGPRKRGPKKRKGDANNAADVLEAMERRQKRVP